LCTDNAAMIASRAYYKHLTGKYDTLHLNAVPSLNLG
jgi:N6-L-threonylcarbamoyladenine synthase